MKELFIREERMEELRAILYERTEDGRDKSIYERTEDWRAIQTPTRTKAYPIVSCSPTTQPMFMKWQLLLIKSARVFKYNPSKIDWSFEEN